VTEEKEKELPAWICVTVSIAIFIAWMLVAFGPYFF